MLFQNGYKGLTKVFASLILDLISTVLLAAAGVAGALSFVAASAGNIEDLAFVALGGTTVLSIISSILAILAIIFKLIGLNQAGKDETAFRTAFLVTIFVLVLTVVNAILSATVGANSRFDDIVLLFSRIGNIIVIFLVVTGIQILADKLGNEKIANRGNTIAWFIAIPYIISAISWLIQGLFGLNQGSATVSLILVIVSAIFGIIGNIMFLVYVGQGRKMLKEGR